MRCLPPSCSLQYTRALYSLQQVREPQYHCPPRHARFSPEAEAEAEPAASQPAMATTNCYGAAARTRRLSDLLQEQQEPFLLHHHRASVVQACSRRLRGLMCDRRHRSSLVVLGDGGGAGTPPPSYARSGRATVLCRGSKAVRSLLPLPWDWDLLAGCFSCGARQRFRRLPHGGVCDVVVGTTHLYHGDDEQDDCGGRQLSPVSVLDLLHSDDDESSPPAHGSTSNPSTAASARGSLVAEKEQATDVSGWERISADIARIPRLLELDLSSASMPDSKNWRRFAGEEEARRVGETVEAIIFEEVRWEAVRDLVSLHRH